MGRMLLMGVGNVGGLIPPPPPYLIACTNFLIVNSFSLSYEEGSGPSAPSLNFKLQGEGLDPEADFITVTPSANIEVWNHGTMSYTLAPFEVAYDDFAILTLLVYNGRLKSGLSANTYNETLTLSGGNVTPFVISITATVTPVSQFIVANGGTITTNGNRKIHVFTGDDIFEVTQLSSNPSYNEVDYLVLAGGAGGSGGGIAANGAGAGAGGYLSGSGHNVTIQEYPITVGAGGSASVAQALGTNGSDSVFDTLTAIGGGRAGQNATEQVDQDGANGGCGGGGAGYLPPSVGGIGSQGGDGGSTTTFGAGVVASAGGGGTSQNGFDASSTASGDGGAGTANSVTGTSVVYGGGGGGGTYDGTRPAGSGGLGGGGNGSFNTSPATAGGANLGGGGGGGSFSSGGGGLGGGASMPGGKGVVVISYIYQ